MLISKKREALFFLIAVISLGFSITCQAQSEKFGKQLVAAYDMSTEQLDKFRSFTPSASDPNMSSMENLLHADTEDWNSPTLNIVSKENPYTIVVKLKATAVETGSATSLWQTGWRIGHVSESKPMAGLSRADAKAGEQLELSAASAPVRFKTDQDSGVTLGLVNVKNMNIHSVRVEVWSGVRSSSFIEILGGFQWVLVGGIMFVLWWFWFRPRYASGT